MVVGSIFIPVVDLLRVTIVRLFHGDSPFKADRQHIHHVILDLLKGKHIPATGILVVSQIAIVFLFQGLTKLEKPMYFIMLLILFLVYFGVAYVLKRVRDKMI